LYFPFQSIISFRIFSQGLAKAYFSFPLNSGQLLRQCRFITNKLVKIVTSFLFVNQLGQIFDACMEAMLEKKQPYIIELLN